MRIISKFHDFYDSIQSVGYDPQLIYHRVQEDHRIVHRNDGFSYKNHNDRFAMPCDLPQFSDSFVQLVEMRHKRGVLSDSSELILIGFCGKYYFALAKSSHIWGKKECFFDKSSAKEYFDKLYEKDTNYREYSLLGECKVRPFDHPDPIEPFRILNAPVFIIWDIRNTYSFYRDKILEVNPDLSHVQFYRLFDAYTTYQELAMFLSGVLGWPENATVDISDEDMRNAKGFDNWSFKKLPTKKR